MDTEMLQKFYAAENLRAERERRFRRRGVAVLTIAALALVAFLFAWGIL